jgi:hypothetical protein
LRFVSGNLRKCLPFVLSKDENSANNVERHRDASENEKWQMACSNVFGLERLLAMMYVRSFSSATTSAREFVYPTFRKPAS